MDEKILREFYDYMENKTYPINAIFIFVYNDYNTYIDDPHLEECFDSKEVHEIMDSVSDIFEESFSFGSEESFIKWCASKENFDKPVYVYTMAQYIEGFGRRTLVPALCQYYNFTNINADSYMSAIGCNKKTMFELLNIHNMSKLLAPSIFFNSFSQIDYEKIRKQFGNHVILKPINESCCIDTIILQDYTAEELKENILVLINKYGYAMLQRYILGQEIGITVVCHNNEMYTLQPMEIVFKNGKQHLTQTDSFYGNYKLVSCNVPSELLDICKEMSRVLGFFCTTRYDFRYDGENYFLFDVSPNPTINGYTSSNFAARTTLQCDHRGILRLMVYEKLSLLKPPLN